MLSKRGTIACYASTLMIASVSQSPMHKFVLVSMVVAVISTPIKYSHGLLFLMSVCFSGCFGFLAAMVRLRRVYRARAMGLIVSRLAALPLSFNRAKSWLQFWSLSNLFLMLARFPLFRFLNPFLCLPKVSHIKLIVLKLRAERDYHDSKHHYMIRDIRCQIYNLKPIDQSLR